jgi:ATP-dependent helicase/nuclease subunit B
VHIEFLLGPAGSGKTFRCLAEIRARLLAAAEGLPLLFLAPKQATFQLERELLAGPELEGYTRLQILSFERLAEFIIQQFLPSPPRLLDEEGRVMVLRALLARHYSQLKVFQASARLPGFAVELSRLLNQLQQHQLSPEGLMQLAQENSAPAQWPGKLRDLALLLRLYRDWLDQNELQDPDRLLELATAAVRQAALAGQIHFEGLWLDGFAELTPQEVELLAALAPVCEKFTLAFCLERAAESEEQWHSMWAGISRIYARCFQRLETLPGFESSVTILGRDRERSRFQGNPKLAHLERFWALPKSFEDTPAKAREGEVAPLPSVALSPIAVCECPDPEGEAIRAAREVVKYVQAGGRFRDVAVLVRSLAGYERVIRRVFSRYDIRFFLDRREPLAHHPLAELTRYALRTVVSNWEQDDWFGALKTGLVHRDDLAIDRLENLALARGWRGSVWFSEIKLPDSAHLEASLEKLRREIVPPFNKFAQTFTACERQPTGPELAEAIRGLWSELQVLETLEAWSDSARAAGAETHEALAQSEIHSQALQQMERWLENVELAFENTRLPLAEWIPIMESGLAALSAGVIPLALDQVLVGEVDRSRNPSLEMVLLLGMNETVFPAPPSRPALLSESDLDSLARLGLELGQNQRDQIGRERLLGYIGCTRARQRLVLTYSQRDAKGKALNPSIFIEHLRQLFPGLEPERFSGTVDWHESVHSHELVAPILKNKGQPAETRARAFLELEHMDCFASVLRRWERVQVGTAGNRLSAAQAAKLYGPELECSISGLEDYAACPFKFFVVRGIRGEERQEFRIDRRERGSFQHEVLMEFHRDVQSQNKQWRQLDPQAAAELIGRIGARLRESFRDGLFASSPERRFEAQTLIEGLKNFIAVLVQWAKQYEFDPAAVELSFDAKSGGLAPWRINLSAERQLVLRGRIDRIDLKQQPGGAAHAVVIDYKAGGQELAQVKLDHGLDLQLMAYLGVLKAAKDAQAILGAAKLEPAGAFYVGLRPDASGGKNRADLMSAEEARRAGYQHRGRFREDLLAFFDNRGQAKGDQFKYGINRDGAFAKRGNEALPREDFLDLVKSAETFLRRYGEEIYAGRAEAEPYRIQAEQACDRCGYQSICRFDAWVDAFRVLKPIMDGNGSEEVAKADE